jgi:phosphoglycerol transferase MdoB-like AlkP superfamily enzyme
MLLLFITANILAASLQFGSLKPYQMSVFYWITQHKALYVLSVGILFVILLGLVALFNNIYCALIVAAASIGVLDISQYDKLKLLHEPIYPWDLKQVKNISEMLNIVRNMVSPVLVISLVILVLAILVATFWLPRKKTRLPLRIGYILAAAIVIFSCTHLQNPVFASPLTKMGAVDNHWNQTESYLENGFMLAFLENINAKIEAQPSDYSQAAMNEIVKKYENITASAAPSSNAQDQPNIVFVMDESLFDPTRLTNISFSEDPMQNFHQFKNTYATGYSLSPVFGGGTSNVEFEALTGLNMSFINEGGVPYQQVLAKKNTFPSLVSLLKSRGYDATAVHPFDKTFYNRDLVYPVLGFDKFISQDDIKYKDKLSSEGYISDMSAIKQVIDVLNAGDQPHFVHLVTMQNHLPVMDGMNGPNTIQVSGIEDNKAQVELESYAQGVKETNKADQYLVDSIQNLKRPTIVVVWGDHLPAIQAYDQHVGEMTAAEKERFMHETPLLVAANFPLQDKNIGTLAPSFFGPLVFSLTGQKLPAYYQLLEQVKQQLPGISPTVYVDGKGEATTKLNDDQKKLLHDYELVQYDLLYGKGYAKSMIK